MHMEWGTLAALVLYFGVLIGIGVGTYKKTKTWKAMYWEDGDWDPGSPA